MKSFLPFRTVKIHINGVIANYEIMENLIDNLLGFGFVFIIILISFFIYIIDLNQELKKQYQRKIIREKKFKKKLKYKEKLYNEFNNNVNFFREILDEKKIRKLIILVKDKRISKYEDPNLKIKTINKCQSIIPMYLKLVKAYLSFPIIKTDINNFNEKYVEFCKQNKEQKELFHAIRYIGPDMIEKLLNDALKIKNEKIVNRLKEQLSDLKTQLEHL